MSVTQCNHHLLKASTAFRNGKIEDSLIQYQKAIKLSHSDTFKQNLRCTIAVISSANGDYEGSVEMITPSLDTLTEQPNTLSVRILVNLVLLQIIEEHHVKALDYFQLLLEVIECQKNLLHRSKLIQYASFLLFRVKKLQELGQMIEGMDLQDMNLSQAYFMSVLAFGGELCSVHNLQRVQSKCYQTFIKFKRYDLAVFALRVIVKYCHEDKSRQQYEKQLGKLVMMGFMGDDVDVQNYQAFDVVKAMVDSFIGLQTRNSEEMQKISITHSKMNQSSLYESKIRESNDKQIIAEWGLTIGLMMRRVHLNQQMQGQHKKGLLKHLEEMKGQNNTLVIRDMLCNTYFCKNYAKVQLSIRKFSALLSQKLKVSIKISLLLLRSCPNRSTVNIDESNISVQEIIRSRQNKQNLGISIISNGSKRIDLRKKIFIRDQSKILSKMLKLCQYGAFLNKRNYNNSGGTFKFVRVTQNFIKWGKDPQKIEDDCQIYPLKDIRSIVYGRVTPNLNLQANKILSYSKCFSLLLQKRTLDFYCKDYEQVETWVCGLSFALKKQDVKVVGYSLGKFRWKKMFAILRQNFIQPLKAQERNKYYYENAYSLILFRKNGYRLPAKK